MNSEPFEKSLHFPFNFPTYKDWLEVARQELEGADPNEKLRIKKGSLEIHPFYTATQHQGYHHSRLKASANPYYGARSWANMPKISVSTAKQANETALAFLNSGADGLLFDVQFEINPADLLGQISLSDCTVSFLVNGNHSQWIHDYKLFAEQYFNKAEIKGCLFWQGMPENPEAISEHFAAWQKFRPLGILVEPHEDAVEEIAQSLSKAIEWIEAATIKSNIAKTVLDQISFSIVINTDFFLAIAKIKSLRNLWQQVRGAYQCNQHHSLHLHANIARWVNEFYQPHGNMIRSTTSAIAAIAGGCDSITVEPEDHNHNTMSRIAKNVSSILREEAHLSKVADPTAGSYYIDALTDQLSEKAWSKFQLLMKR